MKYLSWNKVRISFKFFMYQLETKNVSLLLLNCAFVKGLNVDQSVMCGGCLGTTYVSVKCDFSHFHLLSTLLFADIFSHKIFL